MEKGAPRGEEPGGRRVSRCARWIAGSVGGLSSAPGPRARRGPFPRSGARRAGRLPAIDGFAASFSFLARKWHIAARWGRRRDRRRRTACSPEDASGKAPHAFDEKRRTGAHLGSGRRVRGCGARTARAREHVPSEEATDRYTDRKYAKNHSLALQSWQSQDLSPVDSGLFASLPAPHDRVTRASRAEGPHTRSTSRGPRRRALDARRIAVRLASRTVKNLWSRAAASRRRRATPASERDAPRELPHRRPAVSPRARRCATPRAGSRRVWRAPRGWARAPAVDRRGGGRRPRARPPIGRSARARRARATTPGAEPPRTRTARTSGSGSRARSSLWTRGWTRARARRPAPRRRRRGRGRPLRSRRAPRRACRRARPRTPRGRASSSSGMTRRLSPETRCAENARMLTRARLGRTPRISISRRFAARFAASRSTTPTTSTPSRACASPPRTSRLCPSARPPCPAAARAPSTASTRSAAAAGRGTRRRARRR